MPFSRTSLYGAITWVGVIPGSPPALVRVGDEESAVGFV